MTEQPPTNSAPIEGTDVGPTDAQKSNSDEERKRRANTIENARDSPTEARERNDSIQVNKEVPLADELSATDSNDFDEHNMHNISNEKSESKDRSLMEAAPTLSSRRDIPQAFPSPSILKNGGRSKKSLQITVPSRDKKLRFKASSNDAASGADSQGPLSDVLPPRHYPSTPPLSTGRDVGLGPPRPRNSPRGLRRRSISDSLTEVTNQIRGSETHELVIEIITLRADVQLACAMRSYLRGDWEGMVPGLKKAQTFASDLRSAPLMAKISFYQGLSRLGMGDSEGAYKFFQNAGGMARVHEERRYLANYLERSKDAYAGLEQDDNAKESADVLSDGELSSQLGKHA